MNTDPASLDRLHDLVVPAPTPWWLPAPGWLWVLGFASLLAAVGLVRWIVHRQKTRYRREARAELRRLVAAATDTAGQARALDGMSVLLKRTAITAYSRERVAALTGSEWYAFLDATGGTRFGDGLGADLDDSIYRVRAASRDTARIRELAGEIRDWIRQHRALPDVERDAAGDSGDESPAPERERRAA